MQEIDQLFKEYLDFYFTQVNTSFPGVVTEYDAATRRATIQPSLKRRAGNKEFVEYPLLMDVPVQYPGTKKFTIHFPLEKGDEVAVFFSQRSLEAWKATGMDGIEDTDPRRFSLPDAYCTPGLQPVEFIPATKEGALEILHHAAYDGDFISSVTMDDDRIEVKYKEKADIMIEDDDILAMTEKCSFNMSGEKLDFDNGTSTIIADKGKITFDNGKNKFELDGAVSLVSTGSDLVEIGNTVDTLGGILDALFTSLTSLHTEGSPAAHTASAWAASDITPLKAKTAQVFKK
ncbi:hypothetical protein AGMMS49944_09090 [Spirochaetia bacterium]|nr:hypothetical protein AGMMS49944_09090 [Spirochaetia bacterium]